MNVCLCLAHKTVSKMRLHLCTHLDIDQVWNKSTSSYLFWFLSCVFLVCLWCLKYFCKIEGTNEIEEVCTAEMQIIDDCGSQHHAILDIITNTITIALAVTMFKICPGEPTSFRKFSGAIVAAFKACNLGRSGCLGRLSSRPACPWGCTPTNRLYCRDMT